MKVRNIAFGYRYQDGQIIINTNDAKIYRDICQEYLTGKSLLMISNWLNEKRIEYMPGVYGWNKGRIKRLLDDKRYVGNAQYPPIIDVELYNRLIELKASKNTQEGTNRNADIYKLNVAVRCPKCNGIMIRRQDKRRTVQTRWACKNSNCNCVVAKDDKTITENIVDLLNEIIANPQMINIPIEQLIEEPSGDLIKLNNEIMQLFNTLQIDRHALRTKILEYSSQVYKKLEDRICLSQRLKDTFTEAVPLQAFCPYLFEKTVDELKLYLDGSVGLVLINKQEIRSRR